MDLGTALALGYVPQGYPRYGQNQRFDWTQISGMEPYGQYEQPLPPDMYAMSPYQALGTSVSNLIQQSPYVPSYGNAAYLGSPAAMPQTPVARQPQPMAIAQEPMPEEVLPEPQLASIPQQVEPQQPAVPMAQPTAQPVAQPAPVKEEPKKTAAKQLGGWDPNKPFKIKGYYSDAPEEEVTVKPFQPGKPAVVQGRYGEEILDPDDKDLAPEYNMVTGKFNELMSLTRQSQAEAGGYQLTETGQDPFVQQGYDYRINVGGRSLPMQVSNNKVYVLDQNKRRQLNWGAIDSDEVIQVNPTAQPVGEVFQTLTKVSRQTIDQPITDMENLMSRGINSAPYYSQLIDNVGYEVKGVDERGVPQVEFTWNGPGQAPTGYLENVKKKWNESRAQIELNGKQFAEALTKKAPSLVDNYLADLGGSIVSLEASLEGADDKEKKSIQRKIDQAKETYDKIATTRTLQITDEASVIEGIPQTLQSSIGNTWQDMLTLSSGLGWEDQRAGGSVGPIITTDDVIKNSIVSAAGETKIAPTSTNLTGIQKAVQPAINTLKRINEEGVDEYKGDWSKISEQPALFSYEYNGQDVTVEKSIPQAVRDFNTALGNMDAALTSGDTNQIAAARAELDAAGALFSGSITAPGGVGTYSVRNGNMMQNLSGFISLTDQDRANIAGRIYGGSIMPNLQAPAMQVFNKPSLRGPRSEKERRTTVAYPGLNLSTTWFPLDSMNLGQVYTSSDGAAAIASSMHNSLNANDTAYTLLANSVLDDDKSGFNAGQAAKHSAIIERANKAASKETPEAAEVRRAITLNSIEQANRMGFALPNGNELANDAEVVFRAYKAGKAQGDAKLEEVRKKYSDPNNANYKAWKKAFDASAIGAKINNSLASRPELAGNLNKGVAGLFESFTNRAVDILYLYRNAALYGDGKHAAQTINGTMQTVRFFANPFLDDGNQQSIMTMPSAVNVEGEVAILGTQAQIDKLNNKKEPGLDGQYDPAGSFGIATMGAYMARLKDLQNLLKADPVIANEIKLLAQTNYKNDMKEKNIRRPEQDAYTRTPALDKSVDMYLQSLLGISILPKNRIFSNRTGK